MNLRNKVYQMFMIAPQGAVFAEEKNLITALETGLGGVIFFTKNIQTAEQTKNFTHQIKEASLISPFLGIDEEGGRVERTENIFGGKKFLSARLQAVKGIEFVIEQTEEISKLIKSLGFNMNFAPVFDVDTNPQNPIIAERAYGKTAQEVEKYAISAMNTYIKNGIIPVGKHFPGHGDANIDSHLALPTLDLPAETITQTHIQPFKTAIKNNIPAIMAAHLYCPCFDSELIPASLSKKVLNYLRIELGFNGIIISDDMQMGALKSYKPQEAIIKGIQAGINLFLYRDSSDTTLSLIESTYEIAKNDKELSKKIEESFDTITTIKTLSGIN